MDFGTQLAILILWGIFSAIVTKFDEKSGKIIWIIEIGIFSIFTILDILDAMEIINFLGNNVTG